MTTSPSLARRVAAAVLRDDRRTWATVFVVVLATISCWAVAAPYFSGPDEASHAARVWSISRGQLLGSEMAVPGGQQGGNRIVEVPRWLALSVADPACFKADENASASCASLLDDSTVVETSTTAGAQLPFTYLPAALGFVVASHGPGLLLVRVLGAVVTAALLASSVLTARRSPARRWLVPAIALACPPMFLYIAAVTNPSGPEIAGAIAVWISLLALAVDSRIETRVLVRLTAGAVVLVLARQLGPVWLAVIVLAMVPSLGWARVRVLIADRRAQVAAGVIALSGVVWALWSVLVRPLATIDTGFGVPERGLGIVRNQAGRLWLHAQESVGVFGWLEVRAPFLTYLVWVVGILLLVGLCWMANRGWRAVAPVVVLAGALVLQTAAEYRSVPTMGYFWQGRYTLPVLVGVPLLAGAGLGMAAGARRPSRSSVWAGAVLLGTASFAAFAQLLRRYSVGAAGPLDFILHPGWSPVVPIPVLLLAYAILTAVWLALLGGLATGRAPIDADADAPDDTVAVAGRP